jgi:hypothetical protein
VIELARHIEILLLDNDCVIVPGLGGFVAHYVDACFEAEENLFLPPQRTLGFNAQLRMNDSLLAQSYAEAYDISYPEAVRRIEDEVNELRQHLENGSGYELNGIGSLRLNEEGHLEFSPYESGIQTPTLYGLGPFEMQPLHHDVKPADETNVRSRKAIVIPVSWLRNAAAVAAAVVCFFLYTTPVSNSLKGDISLGSVNLPMPSGLSATKSAKTEAKAAAKAENTVTASGETPVKAAETVTKTDETVNDEPAQAVAKEAAKPEKPSELKPKPEAKPASREFCIVLASNVAEANAKEFVDKMQKNGFDQTRIYVHNNLRRVVYGSYASESEAYNDLRTLRAGKAFEEAWVYEIKN